MINIEKKRNSGIDLLRTLSMFGIIGLHIINQGGIISNLQMNTTKYYVVLFMLVVLYASVNIFGIMTGYLSVNKKDNKNMRIIELLAVTLFWSFAITGVFYMFNLYNIRSHGIKELICCLFPFIIGRYWYITCYILLFFMIPYINVLIKKLSQKQIKTMLIVLFILQTIIPNIIHSDIFALNNGYSPFWLIFCYMLGGYIRLYKDEKKIHKWHIVIPLLLAYLSNIAVKIVIWKLLKKESDTTWFINYISPFIVWFAIEVFMLFKKIKINSNRIVVCVKYISISSFSVYVIHSNKAIFDYVIKDLFVFFNNYNGVIIVGGILLSIVCVYISCMILDQIRITMFKIFKIDKLIDFYGSKLDKLLN